MSRNHIVMQPRRHTVEMYASARLIDLISDLRNLFSNAHSHDDYFWQVSFKFLLCLKRYQVTHARC